MVFEYWLSSTCRFTGEYKNDYLQIKHIFPSFNSPLEESLSSHSLVKHYFCVKHTLQDEIPYNDNIGENIASHLSLYYGKYFDYLGIYYANGSLHMPDLDKIRRIKYIAHPAFNNSIRLAYPAKLNFNLFSNYFSLLKKQNNNKYYKTYNKAVWFYRKALEYYNISLETSFIFFVNAIETLASTFIFDKDELKDNDLEIHFNKIREYFPSDKEAELTINFFNNRIFMVTRKFKNIIRRHIDSRVFKFSPCQNKDKIGKITEEKIDKVINSIYQMRSKYLHTGEQFGQVLLPTGSYMNDIQLGEPIHPNNNREIQNIWKNLPTITFIEHLVRFVLLKFFEVNIIQSKIWKEHNNEE